MYSLLNEPRKFKASVPKLSLNLMVLLLGDIDYLWPSTYQVSMSDLLQGPWGSVPGCVFAHPIINNFQKLQKKILKIGQYLKELEKISIVHPTFDNFISPCLKVVISVLQSRMTKIPKYFYFSSKIALSVAKIESKGLLSCILCNLFSQYFVLYSPQKISRNFLSFLRFFFTHYQS